MTKLTAGMKKTKSKYIKAKVHPSKAIYENLAKIIVRLLQYSSTLQTF